VEASSNGSTEQEHLDGNPQPLKIKPWKIPMNATKIKPATSIDVHLMLHDRHSANPIGKSSSSSIGIEVLGADGCFVRTICNVK
jgi:hypothetical protein